MWIFQLISVLISCRSFRGKRWKIPVKNDASFISCRDDTRCWIHHFGAPELQNTTTSSQTDTSQIHGNSTCLFILKNNHLRLSICCTASPFPSTQGLELQRVALHGKSSYSKSSSSAWIQTATAFSVFPWRSAKLFIIIPTSQHIHQTPPNPITTYRPLKILTSSGIPCSKEEI